MQIVMKKGRDRKPRAWKPADGNAQRALRAVVCNLWFFRSEDQSEAKKSPDDQSRFPSKKPI